MRQEHGKVPTKFKPVTLVIESAEELRCLYLKLYPEFDTLAGTKHDPHIEAASYGWDIPSSEVDYQLWQLVADELEYQGLREHAVEVRPRG